MKKLKIMEIGLKGDLLRSKLVIDNDGSLENGFSTENIACSKELISVSELLQTNRESLISSEVISITFKPTWKIKPVRGIKSVYQLIPAIQVNYLAKHSSIGGTTVSMETCIAIELLDGNICILKSSLEKSRIVGDGILFVGKLISNELKRQVNIRKSNSIVHRIHPDWMKEREVV